MSNKLKIYQCSGIGDADNKAPLTYWLDGTRTVDNSRAVNSLLVQINYANTELTYLDLTDAERVALYNRIDTLVLCLRAAIEYAGDTEKLEHAGKIVACLYKDGEMNYPSLSDQEREIHLGWMYDQLHQLKDTEITGYDKSFYDWYKSAVISLDQPAFSPEQKAQVEAILAKAPAIAGIGELDKDVTYYIENSGSYFFYLYIPENKLAKCSKAIREKRQKQLDLYEYIKKGFVGIYGSEDDLQRLIRMNILITTGKTPEAGVEEALKRNGIGLATEIVVAIISAIVTVVSMIVSYVIPVIQTKVVAKYSVDQVEAGEIAASDWDGMEYSGTTDSSKLIKWGIVGVVLLMIFKK